VELLAGSPGAGALWAAAAAAVLSVAAVACAWRRATMLAGALALALCLAACAFAATFNVQNSRNVRAAFLPEGPEWVQGHATLVAGTASSRTSVLEQLFWNRALALDLVPGAPPPDVFPAAHLPLAEVRGPVLLDETASALVPAEPIRRNGPWLEARTSKLVAAVGGLAADGWFAPSGSGRVARHGRLSFAVTAPQDLTLTIAGHRVRLAAHIPTPVCVTGRFTYRFSGHGYLGFRPVSAQATFPRFTRNAGC
jgi:hypothetical protein